MPKQYEYKLSASEYKDTPLFEKVLTKEVPTTLAEALAANPHSPNGEPHFPDEATVIAYAVAQYNIKSNHAVMDEVKSAKADLAENKEGARLPTLDELSEIFRTTTVSTPRRGSGSGQRALAAKAKEVQSKLAEKMATASEDQLAFLVEIGQITQDQMDTEIARREAEIEA